jgi:hypothetical protein
MSKLGETSGVLTRCRRFTLLDGMLLIATIALWLGGLRAWLAMMKPRWMPEPSGNSTVVLFSHDFYGHLAGVLIWVNSGCLYLLAVVLLSAFYLCVRLRRPRPSWRQLLSQPGLLICLMVPLAYLIAGCFAPKGETIPTAPLSSEYATRSYLLSAAVGCAWAVAYSVTRRKIEPGWIEWLGRGLVVGWIGIGLVNYLILSLPQWDILILNRS